MEKCRFPEGFGKTLPGHADANCTNPRQTPKIWLRNGERRPRLDSAVSIGILSAFAPHLQRTAGMPGDKLEHGQSAGCNDGKNTDCRISHKETIVPLHLAFEVRERAVSMKPAGSGGFPAGAP